MTLVRRKFLEVAAGAFALPAVSGIAQAQAYPSRPVRIVVGLAAGTSPDLFARLIGQWLSEHLGQAFVIENRPGAGGNIGVETVVRAAPDGYILYSQQQAIMGAIGAGAQYGLLLPFSRGHEEEADYIGLLYMARAGYDPREAIKFWQHMSKVAGSGQKPPEFASTHPSDETRIQRLTDEMPKAMAEYEKSPFRGQP